MIYIHSTFDAHTPFFCWIKTLMPLYYKTLSLHVPKTKTLIPKTLNLPFIEILLNCKALSLHVEK